MSIQRKLTLNSFDYSNLLIAGALCLLALIIRLIGISGTTIQHDEPFTIFVSQFPISSIMDMAKEENNPIGHFIFMKYWTALFGLDVFSVRLPSTIFGSISVALMYFIGKRFLNQIGGIAASLTCLFSNVHVFHAHEARVYALSFMLTAISLLGILYIHKRKWYIIPVTSLAIGLNLYMHFTSIIVVFTICFTALVMYIKDWPHLKKSIIAITVGCLLFVPYLGILLLRWDNSQSGTWVSKPNGLQTIYNILREFLNSPLATISCLIIILAAILLTINQIRMRKPLIIFSAWWLVGALGIFVVSYYVPMYLARYILFSSIGLYFLIGLGTQRVFELIPPTWLKPLSMIPLLILIGSFKFKPGSDRSNKEELTLLENSRTEKTGIVLIPSYLGIHYMVHLKPEMMQHCTHQKDFIAPLREIGVYCVSSLDEYKSSTSSRDFEQVLYFDGWDELVDPELKLKRYLEEKYDKQEVFSKSTTRFYR